MLPLLVMIGAVLALERSRPRAIVSNEQQKLADIHFCAMEMMKLAREAEAEGMHPHEVIGIKRKARETLDFYYEAVDVALGFQKAAA